MLHKAIGLIAGASLFAVAGVAMASVDFQSFGFKINNHTSDTIQPGDDYEITVNTDVDNGDELEFVRIRLEDTDGDVVSTDCQAVGRVRDVNDKDIRFDTESPNDIPNGQYDVLLKPFGIDGEEQSNGCDLDHALYGNTRYEGRLFVDDDEDIVGSGGSSSGAGSSNVPNWFQSWLNGPFNSLLSKLDVLIGGSTSASANPNCAVVNASTYFAYGVYNPGVHGLQAALVNMGLMTPAQVATGPGFYGPKSSAAHATAKVQCL